MNAFLYLGTALLSLANGTVILIVNPARAINRVFFLGTVWISLWFFCVFMAMREGAQYTDGPANVILFLGAPQLCSRSFSCVADLVDALSTPLKGYDPKINFPAIVDLVLCVLLHCAHSVFAGLHTARFLSSTLEAWTGLLSLRLHNWNLLLNPASRYNTADEIPFWSQ